MDDIKVITYFLVAAICCGVFRVKSLSIIGVLVLIYISLTLVIDMVALFYFRGANTQFYNITFQFQLIIILGIYTWQAPVKYKKWLIASVLASACLAIINLVFVQGIKTFNGYSISISALIILLWSYLLLRQKITEQTFTINPYTGFLAGNMIYYGVAIPLLVSVGLLSGLDREAASSVYLFNDLGYIFWSIAIAIGFLWMKPSTK